jgi:hypothetical protein
MRLFRQKRMGVWEDVLEEVLAALPGAQRRRLGEPAPAPASV